MLDRDKITFKKPGEVMDMEISTQNLMDFKITLDVRYLKFWLMFGTLLGFVRDGGFIPYDNDVDVAMMDDDIQYLRRLEPVFNEKGFEMSANSTLTTLRRNGEHIDIYPFHMAHTERWWAEHHYPAIMFEGEKYIERFDFPWRVPQMPELCLEYIYGKDWTERIMNKGAGSCPLGERRF
jgi:hypothetical protein